ncbi:hypothetical protein PCC7418_0032 [Halothece sp. PCC 7418]|uniref:OB-fold protein n=1 Tax=Halothece sp. (strain PCC 7418) TaxID=65093 RepID=UPI0002A05CA9|nr:hypothetical protein [Halothece sp. PCC 7418]AFZ42288.1 hypothetical protein PCC7418_0032 [Halothece sp. PCC 7418]
MKTISCSNCSCAIRLIDLEHDTQVAEKIKGDEQNKPINPKNLYYCPNCGVFKYVRKTNDNKFFNLNSLPKQSIDSFFIKIRKEDRNPNEETLRFTTGVNYTKKATDNINTKSSINSSKENYKGDSFSEYAIWLIFGLVFSLVSWGFTLFLPDSENNVNNTVERRTTETSEPEPEPEVITAREIYEEYDENEIAADSKYEGDIISLTGTITDISKDIRGYPYLIINSSVQCVFQQGDESKLEWLSKGEKVTVKGRVKGLSIVGQVLLTQCEK